jgi:hypothetical protein
MEKIHAWLRGTQDYGEGVALYDIYGSSAMLKRLFASAQSRFNAQKLTKELQQLYTQKQATAQATAPVARVAPRTLGKSSSTNPDVQSIESQWRKLYAEASHLHATLFACTSEGERGIKALLICSHFDKIQEAWHQLDYFKEYGHLPEPMPPEAQELRGLDRAILEKMRRNLIANISHARAGRKRPENIPRWEQRRDLIQALLEARPEEGGHDAI